MKSNGNETEWEWIINIMKCYLKGKQQNRTDGSETEWIIDLIFWAYEFWKNETERSWVKESRIETERKGMKLTGKIRMVFGTERNESVDWNLIMRSTTLT